eukprot:TRINITY_DN20020_c0_g1_i1.p1 TRINITY_DN20020_c0_g1~~TRINITY_DN20020_c0_g1_i1.p1  ORF type:complete len:188 (+),score=39.05 TRINITY_DN20020_c0_g1_i1:78-641(+)
MGQGAVLCCQSKDCCNEESVSLDASGVLSSAEGLSQYDGAKGFELISEDARQQEKARLKLLVRSFTSTAIRGVPCQLVDLQSGKTDFAEYSIDRWLRVFTIRVQSTKGQTNVEISRIVEVMHGQDLPSDVSVPDCIGDGMRQRMIVLRYQTDARETKDIAFLEGNAETSETCLTCLNILRLYSEVAG